MATLAFEAQRAKRVRILKEKLIRNPFEKRWVGLLGEEWFLAPDVEPEVLRKPSSFGFHL